MNPTDILKAEHRVIEQVLDCLDRIAREAKSQGRLAGDSAREALDFFRNFADRCHHGKEEDFLFPAMEAQGFPRQGGPTGVMIYEHEQGRQYTRDMDAAVAAAAGGDLLAVKAFCTHAEGYGELLREHIAKEDHCLFGMANQALSAANQARLLAQFELVESDHMGAGTQQRYLDLANRLAERYGVTKPQGAAACHAHACGHP